MRPRYVILSRYVVGSGLHTHMLVLITSLWTFIYMMISFCSLLSQYHVTQMLCILHSFIHAFIHSFTHSFTHSFIHSFINKRKHNGMHNRASACTTEQIKARVQASKFRVYSQGSARPDACGCDEVDPSDQEQPNEPDLMIKTWAT